MLNFNKTIETLICLQIIIISTMIPAYISIPFTNKMFHSFEMPITWQIPSIIVITLIFKGNIVLKAFSLYLLLGLFFLPVFNHGGSLGYLLTPNFGFLIGIIPLIKIIDNLNNYSTILYHQFIKSGIFGISAMHLIGIIYIYFQLLYFKQTEILLYSISNYSLGKYAYHLLMLTPIFLLIKPINHLKKIDKQ